MRLVYLILAHRNPEQVRLLIRTLSGHQSVGIYLHVDARAHLPDFTSGLSSAPLHIVTDRARANWGTYGIVRATLFGLRSIVSREREPYFAVLLSGQDFPVKPLPFIERFFADAECTAYLRHTEVVSPKVAREDANADWKHPGPDHLPPEVIRYRYGRYWLRGQIHFRGVYRLQYLMSRLLPLRHFPAGFRPFYGQQWWAADREMTEYVAHFAKEHNRFRRFFRTTEVPDEMFFHTIMMNSPLRDKVCNDHLRYVDWTSGGNSPRVLTYSDIPQALSSPALFARKFDDVDVVAELARRVGSGGDT